MTHVGDLAFVVEPATTGPPGRLTVSLWRGAVSPVTTPVTPADLRAGARYLEREADRLEQAASETRKEA